MGKLQQFDWGTIDWIFEPEAGSTDKMHVGISTLWPRTTQPQHIHCGDEQLMYIISGRGEQRLGDERSEVAPGMVYHITPGTIHETVNRYDEPIVKLLISTPASYEPQLSIEELLSQNEPGPQTTYADLMLAIRQLYEKIIVPLKMPVAFFDWNHQLLFRNNEYPSFCCEHCHVDEKIENCELYSCHDNHIAPYYKGATAYICRYGISVYSLSMVYKNDLLGYVKAGHIREGTGRRQSDDLPYDAPHSTVNGVVEVMHQLVREILNFFHYEEMKLELGVNQDTIAAKRAQEQRLQQTLKSTQTEAFNLQISQHFLFNTLNTIAGMAIRENAFQTYSAVGNLAQFFRYTLRTSSIFVELREEIEYLENYTNLQKLRFSDRLTVTFAIPAALLAERVPFNFLQPIVENCFKHAFKNTKGRIQIRICAERIGSSLRILVADNGEGMAPEVLLALRERITGRDPSGGTAMLIRKLRSLYGEQFSYQVDSSPKGTAVEVTIPLSEGRWQDETNPDRR